MSPADDRAADWDPGRRLRRDNGFYQFALWGDYEFADGFKLTSITSWAHMNVNQLVDQDGTSLEASLTKVIGKLSSFSQEVRVSGDIGPASIVLGGNYSTDHTNEIDQFRFPYTTSAVSTIPGMIADASDLAGKQRFLTKAVFGNVDLKLGNQFVLHGGLRYTSSELDSRSCARAGDTASAATYTTLINVVRGRAGLAPIAPLDVGSCVSLSPSLAPGERIDALDENNVSWRVGVDWKPAPQMLIYANVSRGYKAGSAPTLPAIEQSELAPVTQESVLAYEAGFKLSVVRSVVEVTGAAFYYDYSDKQLQGRKPTILGVLPGLVNVPKSRIAGAEFQINTFPARGLRLSLGGTYLSSKVTGMFDNYSILGLAADFKGNAFPYTPDWQLVADGQYEPKISDTLNGVLGFNVNYRSSTNAGFGNDPRLAIDSYELIDLRAGIKASNDRWQATLYVRNLTDKYYWTNVARLSDVIRRYAGEPRTYGIQLSTKF